MKATHLVFPGILIATILLAAILGGILSDFGSDSPDSARQNRNHTEPSTHRKLSRDSIRSRELSLLSRARIPNLDTLLPDEDEMLALETDEEFLRDYLFRDAVQKIGRWQPDYDLKETAQHWDPEYGNIEIDLNVLDQSHTLVLTDLQQLEGNLFSFSGTIKDHPGSMVMWIQEDNEVSAKIHLPDQDTLIHILPLHGKTHRTVSTRLSETTALLHQSHLKE